MEEVDVAIIGSGVIGLAVAHALSRLEKNIIVIDKNLSFGQETSSRNSEVIHAGLYYPPGSLKAETCARGNALLYELCRKHNIPHKKLGKIIVANDKEGLKDIETIRKNAAKCGVENLKRISQDEIKKLEPHVKAKSGLFSPDTGIIDSHALLEFFFHAAKEKGVDFAFSVEAKAIKKEGSFYKITVKEPKGNSFSFRAKAVVNAGGLWADKVASLVGIDIEANSYKIHYCKGEYFRIKGAKKFSITHLIYPPPSETDLGTHLTPDLAGGLRLGPSAKYVKEINYDINEENKKEFFDSTIKFLPSLKPDDLTPDTAGVRPKLQAEGDVFRDFVIQNEAVLGFPDFVNLIGIESPGLTAAPAIAEKVLSSLNIR